MSFACLCFRFLLLLGHGFSCDYNFGADSEERNGFGDGETGRTGRFGNSGDVQNIDENRQVEAGYDADSSAFDSKGRLVILHEMDKVKTSKGVPAE